jgi:hypothetical protein
MEMSQAEDPIRPRPLRTNPTWLKDLDVRADASRLLQMGQFLLLEAELVTERSRLGLLVDDLEAFVAYRSDPEAARTRVGARPTRPASGSLTSAGPAHPIGLRRGSVPAAISVH